VLIPTLKTQLLLLRGLRMDDLDEYAAMYADSEVMRHLEDGVPLDRAAAWRSMAVHLGHWQHGRGEQSKPVPRQPADSGGYWRARSSA
jgi:RimJ/RimL family protein N-acetyltransferase